MRFATYEKVSISAPNGPQVLLWKSKTLGFIHRYTDALVACEQVIAAYPTNVDALSYKSFLLADLGRLRSCSCDFVIRCFRNAQNTWGCGDDA